MAQLWEVLHPPGQPNRQALLKLSPKEQEATLEVRPSRSHLLHDHVSPITYPEVTSSQTGDLHYIKGIFPTPPPFFFLKDVENLTRIA